MKCSGLNNNTFQFVIWILKFRIWKIQTKNEVWEPTWCEGSSIPVYWTTSNIWTFWTQHREVVLLSTFGFLVFWTVKNNSFLYWNGWEQKIWKSKIVPCSYIIYYNTCVILLLCIISIICMLYRPDMFGN